MENIFNFVKLAMINYSTIFQNSEFKILLCFSIVGIVGMHRTRGDKWSSWSSNSGGANILVVRLQFALIEAPDTGRQKQVVQGYYRQQSCGAAHGQLDTNAIGQDAD